MSVEDDLRLAWQADRDGRAGRRDALLTLAAAGAQPDAPWLAPCRARLIRSRPNHLFSRFESVAEARAHPKVAYALEKLRALYPAGKVANLVKRDEVCRGLSNGRRVPMSIILDDLLGSVRRRRRVSRLGQTRSLAPRPPKVPALAETHARVRFSLSVLWTLAILLEMVRRESRSRAGTRAA